MIYTGIIITLIIIRVQSMNNNYYNNTFDTSAK